MRQWLVVAVVAVVALAGCSGPSVAEAPKSDAVFLSRKPVDGLAECISWGWDHQKFDDAPARYSSKAIQDGVRIATDGGAEHLDVVDIQGKTELNLFLAEKKPDPRAAKRIAVIESCL